MAKLTIREVATRTISKRHPDEVGVDPSYVWRTVKKHRIPYEQYARTIVVEESDVAKWLDLEPDD